MSEFVLRNYLSMLEFEVLNSLGEPALISRTWFDGIVIKKIRVVGKNRRGSERQWATARSHRSSGNIEGVST
jgi:hypothetical protein